MPGLDHRSRQGIADDLMLHIASLLPEPMRGYYSSPADFPTRYFEPQVLKTQKDATVKENIRG